MKLRKKALIVIGFTVACLIVMPTITITFISSPQNTGMEPMPPSPIAPIGFMLVIGSSFGLATMLFLEKAILSRVAKLSDNVSSIGLSGDFSARLSITGKDELSSLADKINEMLARLEQAQSELKLINEKLRVVGEFTRHDARNKLSAVTNNVYLAKQLLTGEKEALEYLGAIESAIEQTERIFDFARTYEKLGVEELAYMNVEKSVEEAVSLFSDLQDVKVVNDCHELTVLADSLLRQLFYNLIDNSLKYGESVKRIRVFYELVGGDQLKLVYEDDGVGIRKDEKERIFKEGYGKNTGYGLYLISKICEVYGWSIQETSKQGKGAQFAMTIPKINESGKENYQFHL